MFAMLPIMIATMLGATLLGRRGSAEPGYPRIPTESDPNIWQAGTAAARSAGASSGRPEGSTWSSASRFQTYLPGLIGR